jgi:hypothetical protein
LQEDERCLALPAQLDEMGCLECALREEDAVVGNDARGITHDMGKAAHEGCAVEFFEFVEAAAIDDAGNDFTYIVAPAAIAWDDAIEFAGVAARRLGRADVPGDIFAPVEVGDDAAADGEGVFIVQGVVIGDAGDTAVHVGSAQVFRADLFARRGFDQWRTSQEDGAIAAHNDCFITHGGNVSPTGGTGTHYGGNLRDALARHAGLVVEDTPEVLAIGKDVGLEREECSPGVNKIDAGQVVLLGNFLGAQVFLDGHGIVGATFDGSVIGDDHAFLSLDHADTGDDTGRWRLVLIHIPGCQWAEFQEGRIGVAEQLDALAGKQLVALAMPGDGLFTSALLHLFDALVKLLEQILEVARVLLKCGAIAIYVSFDDAHVCMFLPTTLSVISQHVRSIAPCEKERQVRAG